MKNHIKGFGQFLNESKFYHSLPNNTSSRGPRLRDEYRALSPEKKEEFDELANELKELGLSNILRKKLSGFSGIDSVMAAMQEMVDDSNREYYGSFDKEKWHDSKHNVASPNSWNDPLYVLDLVDHDEEEFHDYDSFSKKYPRSNWFGNKHAFDKYKEASGGKPFTVRRERNEI